MNRLINEDALIDALVKRTHLEWKYLKIINPMLDVFDELPTIDAVPVAEIYDAGYKGKEVQFRIGGRLFAIRELAQ